MAISFEEMRLRYERREPRPEDLRNIEELKSVVESQERDICFLSDQLRELQLNRQQITQQPQNKNNKGKNRNKGRQNNQTQQQQLQQTLNEQQLAQIQLRLQVRISEKINKFKYSYLLIPAKPDEKANTDQLQCDLRRERV